MKWLLIILEIYFAGCLLMALLSVIARFRDGKWTEGRFLAILFWPAVVVVAVEWIRDRRKRRLIAAVKELMRDEVEFDFDALLDASIASARENSADELLSIGTISRSFDEFRKGHYRTTPAYRINKGLAIFHLQGEGLPDFLDHLPESPVPDTSPTEDSGGRVIASSIRYSPLDSTVNVA